MMKHFNAGHISLVISILHIFCCVKSAADVCEKIDDCTCRKSNGKIISLRKIDGVKRPAFQDILTVSPPGTRFKFDWNPCTKFSEGDGCFDVLMCQTDPAIPGTTYPCAATVADFKVESDGTTTIMYKAVPDYIAYERIVRINLKCDESKFPGELSGVTENYTARSSTYTATLTSKCACDDGCISDDVVL